MSVNIPNFKHDRPFHVLEETLQVSAAQGKFENVKAYIETNQMWIDQPDQGGRSALYCAAQRGHVNIVEYLLSKEASTYCPIFSSDIYIVADETVKNYLLTNKIQYPKTMEDTKECFKKCVRKKFEKITDKKERSQFIRENIKDISLSQLAFSCANQKAGSSQI